MTAVNYRPTLRACYLGYVTQAVVNNLAPLLFVLFQTDFSIPLEKIGQLILLNFGTQLLVDLASVKLVDRLGYRFCACAAHLVSAAGLALLGVLPRLLPDPYLGLVIPVMVCAVGGGLIEVLISPIVEALPGDAKASAMSLLHAFYCWGQVLVVLLSTLFLRVWPACWPLLTALWGLLPFYNFFRFLKVPLAPVIAGGTAMSLRELFSRRVFWLALLMMMCAGSSELAMSQWSSLFAERGLGVPKMLGDLLGPCLFALLMGAGRTLYGIFGERLPLKKLMAASSLFCVCCYLVTVFAPHPVVSLLGCAACGLSVSLLWPGTFSLSSAALPLGGTAMFSLLALAGDLGGAVGPWLAGLVSGRFAAAGAEQAGLRGGLLAVTVFPLLMLAGVLVFHREQKQ
ncbi:MFS transporter [Anaerofilum sp. BX8]|uniref:MFS transporter n=1 Tax=Anaerofilum hominis TaxID=2763016 RepID=A0A923KX88_9FIRM|nr:MFS transporter [Anaerofilum hominis]MBC5580224.1 MFS transporter [Anaerofilum hominis]